MNAQPDITNHYQDSALARIEEHRQTNGKEPAWLSDLRSSGLKRFQHLGFPHRKQEAWKHIDLRPVMGTAYHEFDGTVADSLTHQDIANHLIPDSKDTRLVFINGYFQPESSAIQNLPDGVIITDLQTAFESHADLIQPYLAHGLDKEPDAFAALNSASFVNGPFVYVPEHVNLKAPVQMLFYTAGHDTEAKAAYHRGLFIAGAGAKLRLFVQFVGQSNQHHTLNNEVFELFTDKDAEIHYTFLQSEGAMGNNFATTKARLETGSKMALSTIALNGNTCRHNVDVRLLGEHAECTLNGLSVLKGTSQIYNHTEIHHVVPECSSHQLYKGILDGQSRNEFDGTIVVHKDAQKTDSVQLNKNLLLSQDAQVFTRPQLRIDADDVKCAHGATVGQLEEEQLFYLASRGLNPEVAQCVLTFGFAEEVVNSIPQSGIQNYLNQIVLSNLGHTKNPLTCFTNCETCPTPHATSLPHF